MEKRRESFASLYKLNGCHTNFVGCKYVPPPTPPPPPPPIKINIQALF
jgi:hypothetical protein